MHMDALSVTESNLYSLFLADIVPTILCSMPLGSKQNKVRRKQFFVEAGACDGELLSNTLFFEMKQKWTGLLIEPNPAYIQRLKEKGRRAWIFPHCISPKKRPMVVKFDAISAFGGIINDENKNDIKRPADINCILDPKRAVLRKTIQVRVHVYYMNSIANIYSSCSKYQW